MFEYAKKHNHTFMVAYDYRVAEGVPIKKKFASYPSCGDFLLKTFEKTNGKYFYEIIAEGRPCKLFLDVEWYGPRDTEGRVIRHLVDELISFVKVRRCAAQQPHHFAEAARHCDSEQFFVASPEVLPAHFRTIIQLIRTVTQDKHGLDLEVRVLTGSRMTEKGFKNSYHVVGTNLGFASSCSTGPLHAFVHDFANAHKDDPLFFSNQKSIIDMSVYSRNRQLRTPFSCKLGDTNETALQPLIQWWGTDIADAFVTHKAADLPIIIQNEDVRSTAAAANATKQGARRDGGNLSQPLATVPVLATKVQQLQALLDAAGSEGCQVTSHAIPTACRGVQKISCKNLGTRVCLVSEGEKHVNNNAWLKVDESGRVHYGCHGAGCKIKGPKYIGTLDEMLPGSDVSSAYTVEVNSSMVAMEVDGDAAPSPSASDESFDECASACLSHASSSSSRSNAEFECAMYTAVIRELALMGPVDTPEEASAIVSLAVKAAGGQNSGHAFDSLVSAATEWLYRSFDVRSEAFAVARKAAKFSQDVSVEACTVSLAQLWRTRRAMPGWIKLRRDAEKPANGHVREMTSDKFERSVCPFSTQVRSMVLFARLCWPNNKDRILELVRHSFKSCGLKCENAFESLWSVQSDPTTSAEFVDCILEELYIMEQPFLRNVLPRIMTPLIDCNSSGFGDLQVARYELSQDELTFWLDTEDHTKSTIAYRLSFCTGDITSPNGNGIIHNMYGMRAFFEQDGNINLMAELLAERGMARKMRFDEDDMQWRIYDEAHGVWRHPQTRYQPEGIVSACIHELLEPLKELEFFFGRELVWERRTVEFSETREGEAVQEAVVPDDSCSQASFSVGSKRSRSTASYLSRMYKSRLSLALKRYGQNPRDQTEILKMLQHKVIFSFSTKQKPYLLCCANGLVDLRTGEFIGKPSPDDFITQMCPIKYEAAADTTSALELFADYFPIEEFPDQSELITFVQQYVGYCLTMETNLQLCLFLYGNGSNGKSIWLQMLNDVFGKELCHSIPVESLNKARGQNNDSLHDARHARLVTLSETDGPALLNEAVFRTLVCGETITNKAIYQKETNFKPHMKLLFMANDRPQFAQKKSTFCTSRRIAYLRFRKIFVDTTRLQDRMEAEALKKAGGKECLIQTKDPAYYSKCVAGKETSFLKFFINGARDYYANNMYIKVPDTMFNVEAEEAFDMQTALEAFVTERLYLSTGSVLFVADLYDLFRANSIGLGAGIKFESYNVIKFGTDLASTIEQRKAKCSAWAGADIYKKQVKHATKRGMAWMNLACRSEQQLLPENRFAAPKPMD